MRKAMLLLLVVFAAAAVAMAQVGAINQTQDVLGAHLAYGRGCPACHAPHSGPAGNNITTKSADAYAGDWALWGQDLTPLYGLTLNFGDGGTFPVTLPGDGGITSAHDAATVVLFCLSCHDGNLAKWGMMTGHTVETIPIVGGNAPTFLGNDGTTAGNYENDHPVGGNAIVTCGGAYNWDCTGGNTTAISMTGNNSSLFLTNYPGSFWNGSSGKLATFGTAVTAVTCTSCHNQHSMTAYTNSKGSFQTSFFIMGNYVPDSTGNNSAQFCRNCHGGESNEMNGAKAVPTT